MTFNELFNYCEGAEERRMDVFYAIRLGFWANINYKTKKRIKPRDLFALPNDEQQRQRKQGAPRITKEQDAELDKILLPAYRKYLKAQNEK